VEQYFSGQEARNQIRIIFGATTIVRRGNQEFEGPKLFVTKADRLVENMIGGGVVSADNQGDGDALAVLTDLKTNANFDALASVQKPVQTASNAYALR